MKSIVPCNDCPWRKSTPRGGFPGGGIDAISLIESCREGALPFASGIMQCHKTADTTPRPCAGFLVQHGHTATSARIGRLLGLADPTDYTTDAPLRTLEEMVLDLGVVPAQSCSTSTDA
jgi:hypothetical protein